MMKAATLACLFGLAAQSAFAGAWAREKGELFIAAGGNFLLSDGSELPVHYDPTLYAEYGLTDRITIGLDVHTAQKGEIGTAFGFVSVPVGDITAPNRYMVTLAYGLRATNGEPVENLLRGGFSWGRGLDNGWLALDASATFGTIDTTWRPKVDATWGRNWNDSWTTTFQLQTGQGWTNDYYAKISPSVIWTAPNDMKFALGLVKGLTGDKGGALKLETWLTF